MPVTGAGVFARRPGDGTRDRRHFDPPARRGRVRALPRSSHARSRGHAVDQGSLDLALRALARDPTICRVSLSGRSRERLTHPMLPLCAVAFLYGAAQIVAVTTRMRLGWGETVYVSQVSPHVPTAFFSAPRARGITLLPAPLVAVTASLAALRVYMPVLSSVGLVLAYWPWVRLLRPVTAALAALLPAALWMVQFYG